MLEIQMNEDAVLLDRIVLLAAIGYYSASYFVGILFEDSSLDTIILLGLLTIMFIAYTAKNRLIIRVSFSSIFIYYCVIALLFYISGLWAMSRSTAIWWGTEILEITFGLFIISLCFNNKNGIERMISVIVIGGYCVVIYAILFYGWDTLTSYIGRTSRISNDAINANTLGMCIAYAIVGNVYFILKKKLKWWSILSFPSIVVLIATGSRKALFIAFVGSLLLIMELNRKKDSRMLKILRNILILAIFIFIITELANTAAFIGVGERIRQLLSGLFGTGGGDNSTIIRLRLISIGVDIFKKHPFLGIGIDNAKFVAGPMFGLETYYLHNNYIELLADVGIIGFAIYYSVYIVLLVKYIKNRDFDSPEYCFCLTLLVFMLVMDFGMVSFQSKETYFFLLVIFMESERIVNRKEM